MWDNAGELVKDEDQWNEVALTDTFIVKGCYDIQPTATQKWSLKFNYDSANSHQCD